MADWPTTLPKPSVSFSTRAGFRNKRLVMSSNRVRQYPEFTQGLERATVRFEIPPELVPIFKQFYASDLNQGSEWFNMDIPNPDGQSVTASEVRFVTGYQEQFMNYDKWSISATIEYRRAALLTPGTVPVVTKLDGLIEWPETSIGPPATFGVEFTPANSYSSIETGRVNIRPRATTRTELAAVTWRANKGQYAVFRSVFEDSLNRGNDWFCLRLPVPENPATTYFYGGSEGDRPVDFYYGGSEGDRPVDFYNANADKTFLREVVARFASDYSARYSSTDNWDISASVEYVLPEDLVSLITRPAASFVPAYQFFLGGDAAERATDFLYGGSSGNRPTDYNYGGSSGNRPTT